MLHRYDPPKTSKFASYSLNKTEAKDERGTGSAPGGGAAAWFDL